MRILYHDEHVVNHRMHGISRMMCHVRNGLENRGHEFIPLSSGVDVNDGDIVLLPANGFVGVPDDEGLDIVDKSKLPLVSIIYDIIPYVFNKKKEERYEKKLMQTLSLSHEIITISDYSRQDILTHTGYNKYITVIHPGVPFDPPRQKHIHNPEDYFLSVGGYGERKGHTELLEAILETGESLIMVGTPFYYDSHTQDLAREAITRGLLVEFNGVPDYTLIGLYQYAKALIYPTKYEGFGLPVIEAMSCGCPVITCDSTGTTEAAGYAAIYVEPTAKQIAWGMDRACKFRQDVVDKGYEQVKKFDWQEIAADYERVLDKALRCATM
jgi:glycosyltransferase involved in cell wall biosynthesis